MTGGRMSLNEKPDVIYNNSVSKGLSSFPMHSYANEGGSFVSGGGSREPIVPGYACSAVPMSTPSQSELPSGAIRPATN